jgi:hypothetical protein
MKYTTLIVGVFTAACLVQSTVLPRSPELVAREKLLRRNVVHHVPRRGPDRVQLVPRGHYSPLPIPKFPYPEHPGHKEEDCEDEFKDGFNDKDENKDENRDEFKKLDW